jgi:hypothetical protein
LFSLFSNSGHHVVINTPNRYGAGRTPERGLQVADVSGHLEKVGDILFDPFCLMQSLCMAGCFGGLSDAIT